MVVEVILDNTCKRRSVRKRTMKLIKQLKRNKLHTVYVQFAIKNREMKVTRVSVAT